MRNKELWILIVLLLTLGIYLSWDILTKPLETEICKAGTGCEKDVYTKVKNCLPSSTIIETENGTLMINISRKGDKCIRTEKVIEIKNEKMQKLLGYEANCTYEIKNPKTISSCPGSLYEYMVPLSPTETPEEGGGGGGGGTGEEKPGGIKTLYCSSEDLQCKQTASEYVRNCVPSEITNVELRWEPNGYWTIYIKIAPFSDYCWIYIEIINAMNIPPGVPSDIIGYNLTCEIPFKELPEMEELTSEWCEGSLLEYLYD